MSALQDNGGNKLKIFDSVLDLVGNTPLVRLPELNETAADILVKLESFNPLSSVKDRLGLAMIEAAEADGTLQPGDEIIEPTSGNTGIALAFVAAAKGYRCTLVMPDTMSRERVAILRAFGCEVITTPGDDDMAGCIARVIDLLAERPDAFYPNQFTNPANPDIHRRTTGEEIWRDTGGHLDVLVLGIGTGGTFTGVVSLLKERNPELYAVAVEPSGSPVLCGYNPGPHLIQGIGAGFVPDLLDLELVDEVLPVADEDAMLYTNLAARYEGLFVGISSGAALWAAMELGHREEFAGKRIVTLLPDCGERYLSSDLFGSDQGGLD